MSLIEGGQTFRLMETLFRIAEKVEFAIFWLKSSNTLSVPVVKVGWHGAKPERI